MWLKNCMPWTILFSISLEVELKLKRRKESARKEYIDRRDRKTQRKQRERHDVKNWKGVAGVHTFTTRGKKNIGPHVRTSLFRYITTHLYKSYSTSVSYAVSICNQILSHEILLSTSNDFLIIVTKKIKKTNNSDWYGCLKKRLIGLTCCQCNLKFQKLVFDWRSIN